VRARERTNSEITSGEISPASRPTVYASLAIAGALQVRGGRPARVARPLRVGGPVEGSLQAPRGVSLTQTRISLTAAHSRLKDLPETGAVC